MGKVTPPADVFETWTPEAQQGYNNRLTSMSVERDQHLMNADNEMIKSQEAQQRSNEYIKIASEEGPRNSEDIKDGKFGMWVGMNTVGVREANISREHRENADAERKQADDINKEIDRLTIKKPNQSTDVAESKKAFTEAANKNLEADYDRLYDKKKELYKVEQELDDTWFFGKDELRAQIAQLKYEIAIIEDDIKFNKQNLDNTFPPPAPPAPPSMPAVPPVQTFVASGAKLQCPLAIPCGATLVVDPSRMVFLGGAQMANIMDFKPMANIPTMGQCTTMSNPAVAAATAAKLGVFTPAPCVPALMAPWKPGDSTVLVESFPALLNTDTLQCMWGGVITILPG